jgi:putative transcriptional regulator
MDEELFNDLLESIGQMKKREFARKTVVHVPKLVAARNRSGLSQEQFAKLLGVSVRTLRSWEQGQRKPSGAAQTLIRIAESQPDVLKNLVAA